MGKGLREEIRLMRVAAQLPAQISKFDEPMDICYALLVLGGRAGRSKNEVTELRLVQDGTARRGFMQE